MGESPEALLLLATFPFYASAWHYPTSLRLGQPRPTVSYTICIPFGGEFNIFAGMNCVGIGYDVHQLVTGRKLILGGVEIPHLKGLEGHSDADVLMHAICDAVLGALGKGDIGTFFPNTDPRWKNAPSRVFLEEAARQVKFGQGKLVNIDATVMAQAPQIMPHVARMKRHIADALGLDEHKIGIKATTNEHLGFVGREEGIAAMAVASVFLPD